MFETARERSEIYRWSILATHVNGAAESGKYEHVDIALMLRHLEQGDVFAFLAQELGVDVEYALGKLTDVDRHTLLEQWRLLARVYETQQFHVRRSGLALLVAYVLHLIQVRHAAIPT